MNFYLSSDLYHSNRKGYKISNFKKFKGNKSMSDWVTFIVFTQFKTHSIV